MYIITYLLCCETLEKLYNIDNLSFKNQSGDVALSVLTDSTRRCINK